MKTRLELWRLTLMLLTIAAVAILAVSCSDDEETQTVPKLTTGAATASGTTVTVTGEITNAGGLTIQTRGFVYSSTNTMPTLADSYTEVDATGTAFNDELTGLASATTYHIRAYAINSKGAGYGNVVSVATENAAPTVTNVSVTGTAEVNGELTATYTYNDADGDAESGTTFTWYAADNATGTNEATIAGATTNTYTVAEAYEGKFIRVGVSPKAATGTITGTEVKSSFVGAIGEATTVTFTYNGQSVTYGIINSTTTGRKWLDRNLGAPNAPTAFNDYANYGDLFQWGRGLDDHQLIIRNGPNNADMAGVNGTTSTTEPSETSASDVPGHEKFIVNLVPSWDWRVPKNDNLWQGVNGVNNPCPIGWRIATRDEWLDENLGTLEQAYTKLKITITSLRDINSGNFFQSALGLYWTSTVNGDYVNRMTINNTGTTATFSFIARGNGHACRCIKD